MKNLNNLTFPFFYYSQKQAELSKPLTKTNKNKVFEYRNN